MRVPFRIKIPTMPVLFSVIVTGLLTAIFCGVSHEGSKHNMSPMSTTQTYQVASVADDTVDRMVQVEIGGKIDKQQNVWIIPEH